MDPYSRETAVILTHPIGEDDLLYNGLQGEGIDVIRDPMINTEQINLSKEELEVVFNSRRIIFTSKRGVEYFLNQVKPADILDKNFICIGKKTAQILEKTGIKAWWVSNGRTASDLVEELHEVHIPKNEKWVGLLGELAENTLESGLQDICEYKRFNIYKTITAEKRHEKTEALLKAKRPMLVVCTSPSCFNGFMDIYGDLIHEEVGFASIGPTTTKSMKKLEITPVVIARLSTYEGLWQEMKLQLKPDYQ
ncbi:uroporphyrinogen-III synthase [Carboxylicivirga linearis]|uniref:Uroporphyrinogen-III synthase n=1 Tax=Carboxylicivirga linearis TaxID=1628157 RepID=A0ABS5JP96_9BACT|nr:uroporphyrinogen-III synthase [Carboxylicivirga linearis]MBS2096724.1 uroporphyrinogen-III synthase [Carboxylicivirga linearis]